jgi:GT2 family glycosyltransferase/glycosyltransferase involved in cell wall biosynthesis
MAAAPPAPPAPAPVEAIHTPPELVLVPAPQPSGALDPLAREYEPRKTFLRRYLQTLRWDERPLSGVDPLALPGAVDHRGLLRNAAEQADEHPSIDVVVCVHNALEDVRRCLWSLLAKSDRPLRLILVDDGSAAETAGYLRAVVEANPKVTLVHNATVRGYTVAANQGMRETTADYVIVLNSDTIVADGWLARLLEAGASDERIGIIGPLSNAASHQSVPRLRDADRWATNPLPPWMTPDAMAAVVARASTGRYPRLPFLNGFCYVIRRAVIDAIGLFDEEHFASGYSEENDYSYRARQAGFELAVADQGYVFHAKSRSFTVEGRTQLAGANYEIFLQKHGRERILELVQGMERDTSLAPVRHAVEDAASTVASTAAVIFDRVEPLTVVFILPGLGDGGSGGSHSIYQEVRGMRRLGIPARIALVEKAMPRAMAAYEDATEIFQTFRDLDDLVEKTRDADVLSATHFKSVAMLAHVREARDDFLPAYYIQDYEPFFADSDSASEREAIASYTAIDDMLLFAKTHWLCNLVGHIHGLHVEKVEPSIDEHLYVPSGRPRRDGDPVRVVGMVRPRTPRRQPYATVDVLHRLQTELAGQIEVATFGCHAEELAAVTDARGVRDRHLGLLTRQRVARTRADADLFVDLSMYQAFGRTVLEAMACGCTAIAPRLGGVWEFAEHDENLLAVDTLDDEEVFEAVRALVADRDRLRRLQANARATAARYCVARASLSEYVAFENEHARRFGATFRRSRARRSG